MKFIDEAIILASAGNGGNGGLSFRREKCVPFGGPDGGDGGNGGSVILYGDSTRNTLIEFRFQRHWRAKRGHDGQGRNCTGRQGSDLLIPVPLGTTVYDNDCQELLGDIVSADQQLKVAAGGYRGLGNTRFKSSTNRAPRQTTPGTEGEQRQLRLELKVLADVGLLGLPNAGKSTFIRAVSAAKPRVADYPFTTLNPNLGMVRIDSDQSFVVADIPGLIPGASAGAGLGIRFLKHLMRTKLLLHLVDIAPLDSSDPVTAFTSIEQELRQFDPKLLAKPRWLVCNKIDLCPDEAAQRCQALVQQLQWQGPCFIISAASGTGTRELVKNVMTAIQRIDGEVDTIEE